MTNLIAPLLVQFDRFGIGLALSASAGAYYAVPSDVLTRVAVIPLSIIGVLFPAMATGYALQRVRAGRLFD